MEDFKEQCRRQLERSLAQRFKFGRCDESRF